MWVNPSVGRIMSGYGMRWSPTFGDYRMHEGIDIDGATGDPVWAASAGTVTFSAYDSGGGNMVKINHGGGIETWYLHLHASHVAVGTSVTAGQQIGIVGNTGASKGDHLHFETRVNGAPQNPAPFMTARGVNLGSGTPPINPEENDMTPDQALKLDQIWSLLGADGALNTPTGSTVIAHSRATVDLLRGLPNAVWMAPVTGSAPGGTTSETHAAAEWITVMAYRITDLVSSPTGGTPQQVAASVVDTLPDDVAKAVYDGLAARLSA